MINSGIYMIYCYANDKLYIGSTNNFKRRFKRHLNDLSKNIHENKHLQRAWNKYNSTQFEFIVLETTNDLLKQEVWWIEQLDKSILFNIEPPGRPPVNSGENHWMYQKGYLQTGSKNPMFGKKGSENQKVAIRIALKGKKRSESEKKSMSIGRKTKKLTGNQAIEIRRLLNCGVSGKELAEQFNVSTVTISNIKNRKIFKFAEELK